MELNGKKLAKSLRFNKDKIGKIRISSMYFFFWYNEQQTRMNHVCTIK